MDNRYSLPFILNLIITFVIVIYPVDQAGELSNNLTKINKIAEPIIVAEADTEDISVSVSPDVDHSNLYSQISEDLECLALNIYFEARSEPVLGRLAVGHVVMNRVSHDRFPNSICEVVRQGGSRTLNRCQFSWWCDGHSDKPYNRVLWIKSLQLAAEIYAGRSKDPTGGALWYHADYASPNWSRVFQRGPKIGRHIFYRETGPTSNIL